MQNKQVKTAALKFIQRKINKYIVEQINPDFEFVFMGLNGMTIEKELEIAKNKNPENSRCIIAQSRYYGV